VKRFSGLTFVRHARGQNIGRPVNLKTMNLRHTKSVLLENPNKQRQKGDEVKDF